MSSATPSIRLDRETRNAFNELVLMDELARLPVGGLLRVLQTIPGPVLEVALSEVSQSPSRDVSVRREHSLQQGFR